MNQHDDKILVTGATGKTGAALLSALARRGTPFTAMVRSARDSTRLAAPAASLAVADFDDEDALERALAGVTKAYLVTPSSEQAENQQLRFVEHAARGGVSHIVLLSQLAAAENSPVRFLRYHAAVERRIRELGLGYTFLRPNLYFQGLLAFRDLIAAEGRFFAPIGDARVSAVDVRDIGEVAASALTEPGHEGHTYTLTGPAAVTHSEMAVGLSEALRRPVDFVDAPPAVLAQTLAGVLPPWQVDGLLEDYAHYRAGEATEVSEDIPAVLGRPATTFTTFVHDSVQLFR